MVQHIPDNLHWNLAPVSQLNRYQIPVIYLKPVYCQPKLSFKKTPQKTVLPSGNKPYSLVKLKSKPKRQSFCWVRHDTYPQGWITHIFLLCSDSICILCITLTSSPQAPCNYHSQNTHTDIQTLEHGPTDTDMVAVSIIFCMICPLISILFFFFTMRTTVLYLIVFKLHIKHKKIFYLPPNTWSKMWIGHSIK